MKNKPRLYFDSNCFISMASHKITGNIEDKREEELWYYRKLLKASCDDEIDIFTSYLTINECLYAKDDRGKEILNDEVKRLFNSIILSGKAGVIAVEPRREIIETARDLWWKYNVKLTPFDSLHIGTAIEQECAEFITFDSISMNKKNQDNTNILKGLGLAVIHASETNLLPDKYRQTKLTEDKGEQAET